MTEIKIDSRALIKGLAEAKIDKTQMLSAVGLRILRWVDDNFKREGIEIKWKPLSPNTVAGRRKGSSKILQDTGRLKNSFSFELQPGGGSVRVGTNLEYAKYHHYGTRPYTIRPVRARVLAFAIGGGMAFARQVNHPGLPSRPLIPSVKTAARLAKETIEAAINKRLGRLK